MDEVSSKTCKVCHLPKPVDEFARNPNAKDGRNAVCSSCYGKSPTTDRGRRRVVRDLRSRPDVAVEVETAFQLFRTGDPKKDFLIRHLLSIIITPGTNQQSQLTASTKLMELHGLTKETPQSEENLIHAALARLKDKNSGGAVKS